MDSRELRFVYDGWAGYNQSLQNAVSELSTAQLEFRASADMRSVGEIFQHIADGRVDWFRRMDASQSSELMNIIESRNSSLTSSRELSDWLSATWEMVASTLALWKVEDLITSYNHEYQGKVYAVSRQWTIWRIMAHDIHHGGQLSELLALQGVFPVELTLLGGHLTEPPIATK